MINLLPPDIQSSIRYSRYNVILLRYTFLLAVIGVALAGILLFASSQASSQIKSAESRLSATNSDIEGFAQIENNVDILQSKLKLVEQLLLSKSRYSLLLNDLAQVIPDGAYITKIVLTGDESEPLELTMSVSSQQQAAEVRAALEGSERLAFVDIQDLSFDEKDKRFTLDLAASFSQGAAR